MANHRPLVEADFTFMHEAIRLSVDNMRRGEGGPFGAIIVRNGEIVGRGWNQVTSSNDPTAHAEIVAIREACRLLNTFNLDGCVLYVNCEPCPMCLGAIYWARLSALFFAATRKDAADAGFDDDMVYREMTLAPSDRSLPAIQLLREAALPAFNEWRSKPDKIPY